MRHSLTTQESLSYDIDTNNRQIALANEFAAKFASRFQPAQAATGASDDDTEVEDRPHANESNEERTGDQGGEKRRGGTSCVSTTKKNKNSCGDEWDPEESFAIDCIEGKMLSKGKKDGHRKGTVLYFVKWMGYSAESATWEPAANIHDDIIADYEAAHVNEYVRTR